VSYTRVRCVCVCVCVCVCIYMKINCFQVQIAKQTVHFELESLHTRPEQEPILMDMIHSVSLK